MSQEQLRNIAKDCRYFLGDRPCIWHKREGLVCECDHYERITQRVLMIKLDAMGDVLRTTCLLPLIDAAWQRPAITWITRQESVPLLKNNSYVTDVIPYGPDALVHLQSREFDRVVNLDAGKLSAGMAAAARGKEKIGYVLDAQGCVTATNSAADAWLRMGVYDDLKRLNQRPYQTIMAGILGLPNEGAHYVLELTDKERQAARDHLKRIGLQLNRPIIGIHTGGGGRWRLKQWEIASFTELMFQLRGEFGGEVDILLFGGPLEKDCNAQIARSHPGVFDAGCENEVRHFAALVEHCSVLVSGDSLAMHVGLAMGCRTVVLFGPTSHAEIELYGLGEKVIPDLDCLVCYKTDCDFVPNCMQSISVSMVREAIARQLDHVSARR